MNSRVRRSFLSLETSHLKEIKKIRWVRAERKKRRKKIEKEEKEKKKEKEKEKEREKKRKNKKEGECGRVRGKRDSEWRKKNGMVLPFTISGEPAVETCWGKRQSWSAQRELHVGNRSCGFCCVQKGKGFSYIGYFLPSGHVNAILV